MPVGGDRSEPAVAYLALAQDLAVDAAPALALAADDTGAQVVLSLRHARVLTYQIRRLLDLAGHPGARSPFRTRARRPRLF